MHALGKQLSTCVYYCQYNTRLSPQAGSNDYALDVLPFAAVIKMRSSNEQQRMS